MKFTLHKINHFKVTIQWHLAHLQCWTTTTSISECFLHPKRKPCTCQGPLPTAPGNHSFAFFLNGSTYARDFYLGGIIQ